MVDNDELEPQDETFLDDVHVEEDADVELEFEELPDFDEIVKQYPHRYLTIRIKNYSVNIVHGNVENSIVGDHGQLNVDGAISKEQGNDSPVPPTEQLFNNPDFANKANVEQWFLEKATLDEQLHFVLVAVFSGNSWILVDKYRRTLFQRLVDTTAVKNEIPIPFRRTISILMKGTSTTQATIAYHVESGPEPIDTVEFTNPVIQKHALDILAKSLDLHPLRTQLFKLLCQTCITSDDQLRESGTPLTELTKAQAAIGLGEMAKKDYPNYLRRIIRPWARSSDVELRFLVGWVIFAIATDDQKLPTMLSLLLHWAKSQNPRLQWTSGAACSRIGLIDFEKTGEIIQALLFSNSNYVFYSVYASLTLLAISGSKTSRIISWLASWLPKDAYPSKEYKRLGENTLRVFFALIKGKFANDLNESQTVFRNKSEEKIKFFDIWHLIRLNDSGNMHQTHNDIVHLLDYALNNNAYYVDLAFEVMEKGIVAANSRPQLQDIVIRTLLALARKSVSANRYVNLLLNRKQLNSSPTATLIREQLPSQGRKQ